MSETPQAIKEDLAALVRKAFEETRLMILLEPSQSGERRGFCMGRPVKIDPRLYNSNQWIREPYNLICVDPHEPIEDERTVVCVEVRGPQHHVKIMFAKDAKLTRRTVMVGPCSVSWRSPNERG